MRNNSRNYKIAGIPFIIVGLLVNPWLLSKLLKLEFSTTLFSGILITSIVFIMVGWGIIYKKESFTKWAGNKYTEIALIVLNFILVFALLNFIAAIILFKPEKPVETSNYFYMPADLIVDSISLLRQVYPDKSDEEIRELVMFKSPYANHPILEFQEKVQESASYNVGIEGIRYDQKVTSSTAPGLINGSVWVFGGSTTFGQGVKDDETITAYLNRLDTANTYINFGVHAFHQSNEIEKLLLLLKKGYHPSKVIFIDGLNDVIRMIETNFHPLETPALAKSAYSSDYNIATKETGNTVLKQLPVTRLIRSYWGKEKGPDEEIKLPWTQYDNVYDPENLYNKNPRQHFQSTLLRSPYKVIDTSGLNYVVWKLEEMYKHNYAFMLNISEAFDFDFMMYYQPVGVLSKENPFWKDKKKSTSSPLYTNFNYLVPVLRERMKDLDFDKFKDISDVHDSCTSCYVDLTHYNPILNKKTSRCNTDEQPLNRHSK